MCESALAQRRAAYLPKLKELSSAANMSVDMSNKVEMGDISFEYNDCDSFRVELAELYSYSEVSDWAINLEMYMGYAEISGVWLANDENEKRAVFADIIQKLECSDPNIRLDNCRVLLYIMQGAYGDFEDAANQVVMESLDELRPHVSVESEEQFLQSFCLIQTVCNSYLAYDCGVLKALCDLYMTEFNDCALGDPSFPERGHSALSQHSTSRSVSSLDGDCRPKKLYTLADNEILRVLISCLYHMVEGIRRKDTLQQCIHVSDFSVSKLENLQKRFLNELAEPLEGSDKPLFVFLMDVIPPFVRGACPKYPIKKVLLLAWKILLATLGDSKFLAEEKQRKREDKNMGRVQDTIQVACSLKSTNFTNEEGGATDLKRLAQGVAAEMRRSAGVKAFRRQKAANLNTDDLSLDAAKEDEMVSTPDPETEAESAGKRNEYFNKPLNAIILQKNEDGQVEQKPLVDVAPSELRSSPQNGEQTPVASSPVPTVLPWASKVRKSDLENFVESARLKFFGYHIPNDTESLFGFPPSVQQSVEAYRRHLYISLGEVQMQEDSLYNKYPFSFKEKVVDTATERVYRSMLPNMSAYSIGILKVLLAAIPSSKAKTDGALILSDVISRASDAQDMLSNSLNLDVSATSSNLLEEAVRLAIDINRHKEIVVKACTAIVINLLKFFRLSHIYQFENFAQQLVLSNCLPLVLKFLDQNMVRYIQSRNELSPLSYPNAPLHYVRKQYTWPELTLDNVDDNKLDSQRYYLWRNVFSSVNLVRVLNKLTKNKQSRTMMLVVFKSAPILKRCLKGVFQFYTLKLLKMQARYLGRQWRRNNMEIISAVYTKVRHRLNDDWAFANETRCKTWDFQQEERELKLNIEKFNCRRYGHIYRELAYYSGDKSDSVGDFDLADLQPVENQLKTLLNEEFEFTAYFKANYERWLNETVFGEPFNWDSLLTNSTMA